MNKKLISLICAISCSFLWGTAFIAQDMGMDYIGPFSFTTGRMFLGFIILVPFFFFFEFKKIKEKNFSYNIVLIYLTLLGLFLSGGFALQQYSLLYTDVANAAIFTIFYVLIVPAISYFLFSKRIHWSVWPSVFVCIIGGFLLTEINNVTVRLGDSLVLFGAFFWAFHIVCLSKFLKFFNYPIAITMGTCLIGSIIVLIPSLAFENISLGNLLLEKKELLYAGVLSSGIAFLLQAYSQQNLSPAPVAIIFSLEGVFAAIFGWILLNQFLSELKIFGIVLILLSVIFSQLAPIYDKKTYGRD
ncbi:MAG: EamA family transporter [Candidatus Pelagibacter sp. TMED273]|nr:MAG: EamA family transporter [Candidatus Pelagibacter sp. TMED273]|tara:strand:+ start:53 stop:955 length:903 start_codon:yes stop_codon:yes gene_type:complete